MTRNSSNPQHSCPVKTKNLELLPLTPQYLLALIQGAGAFEKSSGHRIAEGVHEMMTSGEVSDEFLAKLRGASEADPWTFGFTVLHTADDVVIGSCGFKGPPDSDGIVEIAYGIAPGHRGRGFATEVAQALVAHALDDVGVRTVRAHTLPESNASTRVLEKSGFRRIGEVTDPEDGLVWRWQYSADGGNSTVA